MSVGCIYIGNTESNQNYIKSCEPTIGEITNIVLEEFRERKPSKITCNIINYADKLLYRLKVTYRYGPNKNKNTHTGYFYNNGKNNKYEELEKIKSYWKYYKSHKYIKIYYLISNIAISNIQISNIQTNCINFYYKLATILFIVFAILNNFNFLYFFYKDEQ